MEGGRCLLASSHAGTRLPIADLIQGPGRSPSARRLSADSVSSFLKVWISAGYLRFRPFTSFNGLMKCRIKRMRLTKKQEISSTECPLPTAALSASGKRVEVRSLPLSPPTSSPVFIKFIIAHLRIFSSEDFLLIHIRST